MADDSDSTHPPACAQFSDKTDPVIPLIEVIERQVAAWNALPEGAEEWREHFGCMSFAESERLLHRAHPVTLIGVARALRHALDQIVYESNEHRGGYAIPLARNAVTALERMVGA